MFTSLAAWWYDKNIFGDKQIFIMERKLMVKRIGMRRLAAFAAAAALVLGLSWAAGALRALHRVTPSR
jgi:hypothetical protein